jgi:hypothetical protein
MRKILGKKGNIILIDKKKPFFALNKYEYKNKNLNIFIIIILLVIIYIIFKYIW